MEKNVKKYVYICIPESLCCTVEINRTIINQLYFSKIHLKKRKSKINKIGQLFWGKNNNLAP